MLLWTASLAWAQEPVEPLRELGYVAEPTPAPEEPAPATFNADKVLITTFQPADAASAADAVRLFDLLSERFRRTNDVVPMSVVPSFDVQGYDAATYMLGCPPGRYAGCELVLGQRTDAVRAVGAEVARGKDEFDEEGVVLTVHVVDVAEAREVASFTVPVPAGREDAVVEGIAQVFDDIVNGDQELRDLRGKQEGTEPSAELDAARKEILAQSLAELEEDLGTAIVEGISGTLEAPRVTRDDLEQYLDRDDRPPWERVGLSQQAYLRYANSGETLDAWRRSGWGRFGRVMLRASGGFGPGPWSQRYEGKVLLSDQTLQPVDTAQVLEVRNASALTGDFEVGFGVLPFLDLAFAAAVHTGETSTLVDEDVQNQVAVPGNQRDFAMSSWQLGARVGFAPFPRWPARPTAALGFASWKGSGLQINERFPRLDAPTTTFLELVPGVEVDAAEAAAPFARAVIAVPVGGAPAQATRDGDDLIEAPPGPTGEHGVGITVQVGILVRIGPLFRPPTRTVQQFDDEP